MWIIFTKGFWTIEEIQNQFIHFGVSYLASFCAYILLQNFWWAIGIGIVPMLATELYQIFGKKEYDKMPDHFRDLFFSLLGTLAPFSVWAIQLWKNHLI